MLNPKDELEDDRPFEVKWTICCDRSIGTSRYYQKSHSYPIYRQKRHELQKNVVVTQIVNNPSFSTMLPTIIRDKHGSVE